MDKALYSGRSVETKIAIFQSFGISKEHATMILNRCDWNLRHAITGFYLAMYKVCTLDCILYIYYCLLSTTMCIVALIL